MKKIYALIYIHLYMQNTSWYQKIKKTQLNSWCDWFNFMLNLLKVVSYSETNDLVNVREQVNQEVISQDLDKHLVKRRSCWKYQCLSNSILSVSLQLSYSLIRQQDSQSSQKFSLTSQKLFQVLFQPILMF